MNNPTTRAELLTMIAHDDYSINKYKMDLLLKHIVDNLKNNIVISVVSGVGTKAVTIQVSDHDGSAIEGQFVIECWLSDTEKGIDCTTAPDGGVTVSTGTTMQTVVSNKRYRILSDTVGKVVLTIAESGADTWYLNVISNNEVIATQELEYTT